MLPATSTNLLTQTQMTAGSKHRWCSYCVSAGLKQSVGIISPFSLPVIWHQGSGQKILLSHCLPQTIPGPHTWLLQHHLMTPHHPLTPSTESTCCYYRLDKTGLAVSNMRDGVHVHVCVCVSVCPCQIRLGRQCSISRITINYLPTGMCKCLQVTFQFFFEPGYRGRNPHFIWFALPNMFHSSHFCSDYSITAGFVGIGIFLGVFWGGIL